MAQSFKFYLNFKNGYPRRIEITEPFGFDAQEFNVEQDTMRYGRDVSFGSEEISLRFEKGFWDVCDEQILPNGESVYNLTMGYEWLTEVDKLLGFESEVEFIISKNGLDFTVGLLDFENRKTDGRRFFEFKIVQENQRAIIKRLSETNVDLFSDKDLNNNPITPLVPINCLLKAKPIGQTSVVESPNEAFTNIHTFQGAGPNSVWFNKIKNITNSGIDNTLTFLDDFTQYDPDVNNYNPPRNDFAIAYAVNNFSSIKAKIKLNMRFKINFLSSFDNSKFILRCHLVKGLGIFENNWSGFVGDTSNSITVMINQIGTANGIYDATINEEHDIDFGDLQRDGKIWFVFSLNATTSYTTVDVDFKDSSITLSATATAISSIIKGFRYVDLFKQILKSINNFPLIAPKYDVGGQFYDNLVFNGYLIRQFIDKPFNVAYKDLTKGLDELCADYQINRTNVFIGQYQDFYPNREIGVFETPPAETFESYYNPRFALINLEYKYNRYEQNKDAFNTIDAVHTESQYKFPNKLVEGKKPIKVPQRRDPFGIEFDRAQGVQTKETTSLSGDNDMSIVDIIELAPGTQNTVNAILLVRNLGGKIQILNNSSSGDGVTFNWELLGFKVGDIITAEIVGITTFVAPVFSITNSILTLDTASILPIVGDFYLKITYYYTDVLFKNRTSEGFTLIENLDSGDNFSNLRYTIRRNLVHWGSYLATACKFKPLGELLNTYFKSNGKLKTQFGSEPIYIENENIDVSSLDAPVITPLKYRIKVLASFEDIVSLCNELETIIDGKIGGFIRALDSNGKVIKGFISKMQYNWKTEECTFEIEEKAEPNIMTIVSGFAPIKIVVNEVGYSSSNLLAGTWFEVKLDRVQIFDNKKRAIINPTLFTEISLNGVVYTDLELFIDALSLLL